MSAWVIDASVAAKWFFNEVHSDCALAILRSGADLHAPDFLLLEMDSVFWKRWRRGDITEADALAGRSHLETLPMRLFPFDALRGAAFRLAVDTGRSVYDCVYLALAAARGLRVVTGDRKFHDAAVACGAGSAVVWIEDALRPEGPSPQK